jgi:hypothetical protein
MKSSGLSWHLLLYQVVFGVQSRRRWSYLAASCNEGWNSAAMTWTVNDIVDALKRWYVHYTQIDKFTLNDRTSGPPPKYQRCAPSRQ